MSACRLALRPSGPVLRRYDTPQASSHARTKPISCRLELPLVALNVVGCDRVVVELALGIIDQTTDGCSALQLGVGAYAACRAGVEVSTVLLGLLRSACTPPVSRSTAAPPAAMGNVNSPSPSWRPSTGVAQFGRCWAPCGARMAAAGLCWLPGWRPAHPQCGPAASRATAGAGGAGIGHHASGSPTGTT